MPLAENRLSKTVQVAVGHMIATLGHEETELIKNADVANLVEFVLYLFSTVRSCIGGGLNRARI